jgi:hypothetical protein
MNRTHLHLHREVRALLASEAPARISLTTLRTDAKASGIAQVIAHSSDPSRVIVVMPGGAVLGTGFAPMGWMEAEELASRFGGYTVRAGEVMA